MVLERKPTQSRFATTVVEQHAGPVREDGVLTRKPARVGMPPPLPVRQSHDDLERVMEAERHERERALLLVKLQDAEEAKQAAIAETAAANRKIAQLRTPAVAFPPASIPPPGNKRVEAVDVDIRGLERVVLSSRLGRAAVALGILLALAWNAFNSVRAGVPEQKVEAVRERQKQNEQVTAQGLEVQSMERERNLRRMRAIECWAKQLRGASRRQGLDLPSLPSGGVTAYKVGDDDPNRPGPPRFVAVEKCPDFPPLPPDIATQ